MSAQLFRGPKWTDEENQKLLGMVEAGKSWVLISAMLKRSQKSVHERAKTLKRKDQKSSITPETRQR
jgi:hypothetical protein